MNPQPVSLADELRRVVERLRTIGDALRTTNLIRGREIHQLADDFARFAAHAVAEPTRKWVCTCAEGKDGRPIMDKDCMVHAPDPAGAYATPAHAAEQPKLTSVWTITEETAKHSHFCYHKDSDEWKCSCGEVLSKYVMPYDERRKLNSLDREMAFVRFNHKDHFRFVLHGLLTSPVAPPPLENQIRPGYHCGACGADLSNHPASASAHNCSVAPGEQPPRTPNDECWKCGLRRETHPISTCKEFVDPPAAEAQERANDEWWKAEALDVIRHARTNEPRDDWQDWSNAISGGLLRAYNRGVATAAKQAREGALKDRHDYEIMLGYAMQDRCMCCGWPIAKTANEGCVQGNCSFRPQGSPFQETWRKRAKMLADIRLAAQPSPQKENVK